MRLFEIKNKYIPNPFPNSKIQTILYHGTSKKFDKFLRPSHGIFAASYSSYAEMYGTGNILAFYANSKKLKILNYKIPEDLEIIGLCFDEDYSAISEVINVWVSEGYDACFWGGDGDSYFLFGNIDLVNAVTGKPM